MASDNGSREWLEVAEKACRAAGQALSDCRRGEGVGMEHDLKSEADQAADRSIRDILESTGIPILSEEVSERAGVDLESKLWIVDPLDGTINFEKGIPFCCVSIALWDRREPVFGVVYDFFRDEVYSGGRGIPTRCCGKRVSVSSEVSPGESILATGFPSGRSYGSRSLNEFVVRVQRFRKVRLLGSAALSLGSVARGRLDAYWEEDIYLWDVAAGIALVQGAGGCVDCGKIDEETMKLTLAAAGTSALLATMRELE